METKEDGEESEAAGEEADQEESAADEAAAANTSATNLTGASTTNVTSATNLTTTEADTEAESGEEENEEEGDDGTKSVYSEAVAKSIKSALSQRSTRTSASSGKYSKTLLDHFLLLVSLAKFRFKIPKIKRLAGILKTKLFSGIDLPYGHSFIVKQVGKN